MKRRIFNLLFIAILVLGLTACGSEKSDSQTAKSTFKSNNLQIDGVYVDDSFEDENLDLLYVFYTVKADEKNLRLASTSIDIKVNGSNEYTPTTIKEQIPKYSDYYYSDFIEDIYVGKELKMVSTFKVAEGDLTGSKDITLEDLDVPDIDKIKINTDDVKRMENVAKICEDLDKDIYDVKYKAEQDLLAEVDESTEKKIKTLINGSYLEHNVNTGKTFLKYKIEFESPNKFTVSNTYLSNSGTYEIKVGYIALKYNNSDAATIFLRYALEDGDITVSNMNEQFATFVDYDPREEQEN